MERNIVVQRRGDFEGNHVPLLTDMTENDGRVPFGGPDSERLKW